MRSIEGICFATAFAVTVLVACTGDDAPTPSAVEDGGPPGDASKPNEMDAADAGPTDAALEKDADAGTDAETGCDVSLPFKSAPVGTGPTGSLAQARATPDELLAFYVKPKVGDGLFYESSRGTTLTAYANERAIGSSGPQTYPSPSADGLRLYFTRSDDRLYVATRGTTTTTFPAGALVVGQINAGAVVEPYVGASEQWVYFVRDGRIHRSSRVGGSFGPAVEVPGLDDTASEERTPVVSADERTIYFSRGNVGTYMATRANPTAAFGAAKLLLDGQKPSPTAAPIGGSPLWISPDQCTLFVQFLVGSPGASAFTRR